jgi:D-alanyl-lipoteichoic acid acyltransferase DltB (MBOAT superfamily)
MLFNSMVFLWFLLAMLVLYYLLPRGVTKYLILAGSYVFYGWWDWRFLGLILATTAANYWVARAMDRARSGKFRDGLLVFSVIFNLSLLGVFKYFNFFAGSLTELLGTFGLTVRAIHLRVVLPVGISFYTFQAMSYTIDVYRRELASEKDFIAFAAFVSFFPQLVAGPIERAGHLLPQVVTRSIPTVSEVREGVWLMLWGFFLKVFMADNLSAVVDSMYADLQGLSGVDVIVCHYAFAFQILGDFAGYSFIAIGVARLFGVTLNDNFLFPYFVKSPSEFWRNWHISLSTWLRDYLYIPLGGNRGSRAFVMRNLLLTMVLGGLWHGAAWHFVLWGFFQGAILVLFRLAGARHASARPDRPAVAVLKISAMFNLTCVGWMIFRTPDLATMGGMLKILMTQFAAVSPRTGYWIVQSAFFISVPLLIQVGQRLRAQPHALPIRNVHLRMLAGVLMVYLLMAAGDWGTKSFIYFQF